ARGGGTGAGDHGSADAVRVHGLRAQRGDGVFVEVTGDDDAGVLGPERVELLPGLAGEDTEVAGVDADGAELRAGDAHGGLDTAGDVVGVHQQGGVGAHLLDLGAERGFLGVVQQDERVRDGAACGDAVAAARFEIRGGGESGEVGGAGGGDGGVFVGTAATHLDDGAPVGRGRHPRGGGGDGAVVVEDRQHQGLQQHAL